MAQQSTKTVSNNGHLPLRNLEAEEALLGCLVINPDAILEVAGQLAPEDFYLARNRDIYEASLELHQKGVPLDMLALADALEARPYAPDGGWMAFLMGLLHATPSSMHVRQYADIVRDHAIRRRLLRAAESIATTAHDEEAEIAALLDAAETAVFDVRGQHDYQDIARPREYTAEFLDHFERRRKGQEAAGLPTGFIDLDRMLDGLQRPHQYVLAGRPAMGKSAMAINIAAHLTLNKNRRVLLFSLEMSRYQILNRIVAWVTGIDSRRKPQEYTEHQMMQLYEAVGALSDGRLFLDTSEALSPGQVRAKAMRVYAEHGLDLVIVDHLHLMRPDREMRRPDLEVGEMSWSLANLGKTLNVPVLTLAQLSRGVESRASKRPTLADLRESGRIEENAYCVLFLYRDSYYNDMSERGNIAEVIVAKHREGPTGQVDLYWKPECTTFRDLAREVAL